MDASDYIRYGDYRCDLVLDTMAVAAVDAAVFAVAVAVAVDSVFDSSSFSMCDYPHVMNAIDSVDN